MAVTGSIPALRACLTFFDGFWCFGGQVAPRAKRRAVMSGRTGKSCAFEGWPRFVFVSISPDACFTVCSARRLLESKSWIWATGPRCTGVAPEWAPKRETPVLASQAFAIGPFSRFCQARHGRKLRLTVPKCPSAATQISPMRLKPPKNGGFRQEIRTPAQNRDAHKLTTTDVQAK